MGLSEGRKSFRIGLAVLTQCRSVAASQPASHVPVAITLNAKASSLKTAIYVHNYNPFCIQLLKNLLPVWLLVRTNLFIPSRFWTTYTKCDNCCLRYIATCGKNLYRCISTFSALKYCSRIFFKSFTYLYEVVRRNFSADFWTFRNFWTQFRDAEKSSVCNIKIDPRTATQHLFKYMSPSTPPASEHDRKKTYKHHVFAPTAGARCTTFPKLCTEIELVEDIKEDVIHFSIQRIVFPTGCTEKWGLIDRCAVSQQ